MVRPRRYDRRLARLAGRKPDSISLRTESSSEPIPSSLEPRQQPSHAELLNGRASYALLMKERVGKFLGIPYDWRRPTLARLKSRWWNPEDPRLFTPKMLGWGFAINFARLFKRH